MVIYYSPYIYIYIYVYITNVCICTNAIGVDGSLLLNIDEIIITSPPPVGLGITKKLHIAKLLACINSMNIKVRLSVLLRFHFITALTYIPPQLLSFNELWDIINLY